jgi:hypothetical protein
VVAGRKDSVLGGHLGVRLSLARNGPEETCRMLGLSLKFL